MYRLIAVVVCLAIACTKPNPLYCADQTACSPGQVCIEHACSDVADASPDANELACLSSAECEDPTLAYCDPLQRLCRPCTGDEECSQRTDGLNVCASGICVECAVSDDCPVALPVCDVATCRACLDDAECEQRSDAMDVGFCFAGTCLIADEVLMVDDDSPLCDDADGSPAAPYCEIGAALLAVSEDKQIIVVNEGSYPPFVAKDVVVQILGKTGASIDNGPATETRVKIEGSAAEVELYRLIAQGAADSADGVSCKSNARCVLSQMEVTLNAVGVSGDNASYLSISRSSIHDNGGGVRTNKTDFVLENNLIHDNGTGATSFGGVLLGSSYSQTAPTRNFRNNTVFRNYSSEANLAGAICYVATTLSSSLFWGNDPAGVSEDSCVVEYSITESLVDGAGNLSMDPLLASESTPPDLHLGAGSPAIDQGFGLNAPALDYFGQVRDDAPDIGADEFGDP